jgi:hypothetical protein
MKRFAEFIYESASSLDDFSNLIAKEILGIIKNTADHKSVDIDLHYANPIRLTINLTVDRGSAKNRAEFVDEPWEVENLEDTGLMVDANTLVPGDGSEPVINLEISIDPKSESRIYRSLYYQLLDVLRHELEHIHDGPGHSIKSDRSSYLYFLQPDEIDSMIAGLRLKAKTQGISLIKAFANYLQPFVDSDFMTLSEMDEVIHAWLAHADSNQ